MEYLEIKSESEEIEDLWSSLESLGWKFYQDDGRGYCWLQETGEPYYVSEGL